MEPPVCVWLCSCDPFENTLWNMEDLSLNLKLTISWPVSLPIKGGLLFLHLIVIIRIRSNVSKLLCTRWHWIKNHQLSAAIPVRLSVGVHSHSSSCPGCILPAWILHGHDVDGAKSHLLPCQIPPEVGLGPVDSSYRKPRSGQRKRFVTRSVCLWSTQPCFAEADDLHHPLSITKVFSPALVIGCALTLTF